MLAFIWVVSLLASHISTVKSQDRNETAAISASYQNTSIALGTGQVSVAALDQNATTIVTGSGQTFASSCASAIESALASCKPVTSSSLTSSTTVYATTSSIVGTPYITTLCDGIPRVVGDVTYFTYTAILYSKDLYTTITTCAGGGPVPTPCLIDPNDCQTYQNALWSSYATNTTAAYEVVRSASKSICDTVGQTGTCAPYAAQTCQINAGDVTKPARLFYWPITTTGGDLCNRTGTTISATPTGNGPNVVVTSGVTITSPSVAISFAQISRSDGCGPTLTDYMLILDPSDVFTMRQARAFGVGASMNFHDIQTTCVEAGCYTQVPWTAYASAPGCWSGFAPAPLSCPTILPSYSPVIYLNNLSPLLSAAPQWGTGCFGDIAGVWDPPTALQSAASVAPATLPHHAVVSTTSSYTHASTAAAPASSADSVAMSTVDAVSAVPSPVRVVVQSDQVASPTATEASSIAMAQIEGPSTSTSTSIVEQTKPSSDLVPSDYTIITGGVTEPSPVHLNPATAVETATLPSDNEGDTSENSGDENTTGSQGSAGGYSDGADGTSPGSEDSENPPSHSSADVSTAGSSDVSDSDSLDSSPGTTTGSSDSSSDSSGGSSGGSSDPSASEPAGGSTGGSDVETSGISSGESSGSSAQGSSEDSSDGSPNIVSGTSIIADPGNPSRSSTASDAGVTMLNTESSGTSIAGFTGDPSLLASTTGSAKVQSSSQQSSRLSSSDTAHTAHTTTGSYSGSNSVTAVVSNAVTTSSSAAVSAARRAAGVQVCTMFAVACFLFL